MSPEMLQFGTPESGTSYQIAESMFSYSADANVGQIRQSEPGESEHDALLYSKLGDKGWGRIQYFKRHYSTPWGERKSGRPLSPKSLATFYKFLSIANIPEGIRPSVFLTDEGHVEICWEDQAGHSIQFEFGQSETEAYIESQDREQVFSNRELENNLRALGLA